MKRAPFSEQHRLLISQNTSRRLKENPHLVYSRTAKGRRNDLGSPFFRSSWEANYARFLTYCKLEWEYEPTTFWFHKIKRGVRCFTPDFLVPSLNEYHEVKGWMDAKSRTKLKRMAKYYPKVKLIVIDKAWFADANKKGLCRLIPHWECRHVAHRDLWKESAS